MKKAFFFWLFVVLLQPTNIFGQTKNYKFCREVITANDDYAVATIFNLPIELTPSQINNLKESIYKKSSIYFIRIKKKKNTITVYHMSQVHFEDIKLLVEHLHIELNFISTTAVDFKESQVYETPKIEK